MWSVADPRCLISGHIVADFTHKGIPYRMCHRCGKVERTGEALEPVPARRFPEDAGAVRVTAVSR